MLAGGELCTCSSSCSVLYCGLPGGSLLCKDGMMHADQLVLHRMFFFVLCEKVQRSLLRRWRNCSRGPPLSVRCLAYVCRAGFSVVRGRALSLLPHDRCGYYQVCLQNIFATARYSYDATNRRRMEGLLSECTLGPKQHAVCYRSPRWSI